MSAGRTELTLEGRTLELSNLGKVFYPAVGFTKGQVIDYFVRISHVLLPHLAGRPLTMKRYPNGVDGMHFYEKNCPSHKPDWVPTAPVWSEGNNKTMQFCLANDLPTLVWTANLANLELHTALHTAPERLPIEERGGAERRVGSPPGGRRADQGRTEADVKTWVYEPTTVAFDLDPGPPADIVQCCEVALTLRDLFRGLGLECFPKTSGSKGMQVYVPLNTPGIRYEDTKPFARSVAQALEMERPDRIVSKMKKDLRHGKIFIDWSQNDVHKTTVCVYSLRAKERPTVSTPLEWREVERCASRKDPGLLVFQADDVLKRVSKKGDLFQPVLELRQTLPGFA